MTGHDMRPEPPMLVDRPMIVPPRSEQVEQSLLGGLLIGGRDAFDRAEQILPNDSAFYFGVHRAIYLSIRALHARHRPVDVVTVFDAGGHELVYLNALAQGVPSASNVGYYAERLTELWRRREDSLNRTLALALAAAVLYVVANSVPMLGLTAVGHQASTTVFGGARQLWDDGRETVAVLVFFTAIVAPALQIGVVLAIVLGALRARPPRWVGTLLRHHPVTRTWSIIEVMMLGVLVALIKIADYATVIPGLALFSLGGLIFLLAAMQASFDPREVWERVEWADARP